MLYKKQRSGLPGQKPEFSTVSEAKCCNRYSLEKDQGLQEHGQVQWSGRKTLDTKLRHREQDTARKEEARVRKTSPKGLPRENAQKPSHLITISVCLVL